MKLSGIRAIIFDLGGTLYHHDVDLCELTRDILSDLNALDPTKHSLAHINRALIEPTEWLSNYMLENNVPPEWEPTTDVWLEYDRRLLSALGVTEDIDNAAMTLGARCGEVYGNSHPMLFEGVKSVLETLRDRGFRLGIASNRYSSPVRRLEQDSIVHLLDAIEFSNVPGYAKPSPYMLLRIADKFGLNPGRCAFVGDSIDTDLFASQSAGMLPILLSSCDAAEVEKIPIDAIVIEDIADLLEIL